MKLIDINAEITDVAIVYTCFNEVSVGACMYRMLAQTLLHADSVTGLKSYKYLTIEQRSVILK